MAQFYSKISQENSIRAVKYYFAYGMNTNIREMTYRCPMAKCLGPGVIDNYKLVFRTHADIEKSEGSTIHGVLWSITDRCEKSLDLLEGYPHYYIKQDFIVKPYRQIGNSTHLIAMAYQMKDQTGYAEPSQHYLECLLEGYKDNNVNNKQIYQSIMETT